ncbi:FIVAR domain-containing protein, partial [Clostridiaceae bacterium NSJ-31]|nr:FIVAR domain-containing protein [Ligaoa zhengdingensis]
ELVEAIDGKYEESGYTAESWAELEKALEEAKAVIAKADAEQTEVYDAYLALVKARDGLKFAADKSLLELAVELAEEALENEKLTEGTRAELESAVTEARALLEKGDATQDELNAMYKRVMAAIVDQAEQADKSALKEAIEEAEALDESAYTEETWAELEEALEAAKEVYGDSEATQSAVDKATSELAEAISGLKRAVNTSLLEMAVELAKKTIEDYDLTQESIDMLEEVIAEAEGVLADEQATQEE